MFTAGSMHEQTVWLWQAEEETSFKLSQERRQDHGCKKNKLSNAEMRDVTERSACGPTFLKALFNYSHLSKS